MNKLDAHTNAFGRRRFLKTAFGAGAVVVAAPWIAAGTASQPKPRIKVGQLGIGHNHASGKMATFRKLSEHYEVVGVVEPDDKWRKQRGGDKAYRDLPWMTEEQLFNTKGLQAVAVETDVPDLTAAAVRCLRAGMHIHLDKPGGEVLSEFQRMLDEARRQKLTVQLGYMFRNNPAVQFCFRAVREGWLGRIFEVHAVMSRQQPAAYRKWLGQFRGGNMYIFGCHMIDLIVTMLGAPDRITPYLRQTLPDEKVQDNGLAVFEYPRTTATVRAAALEVEGYNRRQLTVCGDEGTIDIHPIETLDTRPPRPLKLQLTLAKPRGDFKKGSQEVEFPPMPGRYDEQLLELAQIIRGERTNPYPLDHELLVQKCLLQACGY
jgi:predicted dehydrogenase